MREGGSKAGPFEKLVMYLESPSEARNIKSWINKFMKSTAISDASNKIHQVTVNKAFSLHFIQALNYKGGTTCI